MIDPTIPHNYGCLKHIVSTAPEGTVCNATYPTSTATATICPGDTMAHAVWRALAEAMPDRAFGGMPAIHCVPMFSGTDTRSGEDHEWGCMVFNASPGLGAGVGADGWPIGVGPAALGGQKLISVELSERLYPMFIEHHEIAVDSMGVGENIGGPGSLLKIVPTSGPMECNTFGDGQLNPPYGTAGGTPGIGGGNYKENKKTGHRIFYSAKSRLIVGEDEMWVGLSTGGGGRGDPLKRTPENVLESVFDGMVSLKVARDIHGVVINKTTMTIDYAKTKALRTKIRKQRGSLPTTYPNRPGAGKWHKSQMKGSEEYLTDTA
tara:strand:- start:4 stop:963 length:960 start_codon:yes stop_codon:yes gene_type:complete